MKTSRRYIIAFVLILLAAAAIRLPRLAVRPLHTDEAIHAVKLGDLLEHNTYIYDSQEYHGPALNYFSLIPAWLKAEHTYRQLHESTMRIVPVFFGWLLVALLWGLRKSMDWPVIISSAVLTAFSPAMVFYSRYYIMEILLVAFSFAVMVCGYQFIITRQLRWALLAGLSIGLMHASKETCVFPLAAMGLALLLVWLLWGRKEYSWAQVNKLLAPRPVAVMVISAMLLSALLFSAFLTNPRGILDSYLTYASYFHKAGNFEFHIYPWYYYFKLLLFSYTPGKPLWTEALIIISGIIGIIAVIRGKGLPRESLFLLRFIALYTIILTAIYSAIPYKTPWIALGFLHGFILCAGIGITTLLQTVRGAFAKTILYLIIAAAGTHLAWQAWQNNFKYYYDPGNPWVYSHPGPDVFAIRDRIKAMANVHPDGNNMYIEVVCPGDDYWPLPWYLREFPNIGWWNAVDMQTPAAPVILALAQVEQDLLYKLYEIPPPGEKTLYTRLFDGYMEIRPLIEIRGYVQRTLWERCAAEQSANEQ